MESKVSRRLKEATAQEVCEHIYTPRLQRDFGPGFRYLNDINQAHLVMLAHAGLLDRATAATIAAAMMEMEEAGPEAVELDPAREDAYFNYEAHLMRLAGPEAGGRLHMARSRNDILATQDRLRARDLTFSLIDALCMLQTTLLKQAEAYAETVMPGYTHLQPAQPVTYGFYLAAVAEAVARDIQRIQQVQARLDACPLGAGALAGTAFPIKREESARLLGFRSIVPNALDAVASRDFALELLSAMAIGGVTWSRVAQDYFVWCTHEFGLIDFPDSVAGTSSIMPQKKNPVVLEHLKGKAGHLVGLLMAAMTTVKGVNFTHTGDGNRESVRSLWEAGDECLRIIKLLELVVRTARPVETVMLRRVSEDFSSATDLADTLVREADLSFREAHHVVGAVVRSAMDAAIPAHSITSLMVDAAAMEQLGRPVHLGEDTVRRCVDPKAGVQSRIVPGGPAPVRVREHIDVAAASCRNVMADNEQRRKQSAEARSALKMEVGKLAADALQAVRMARR
ncbi:argininosuccinate lyase [Noviherbaspirillum aerium]|uniref:argininosuccinate lyase n=1 Tax=Noviherbaspirillum aerium TaxID=2588497 RepID=UPI00124EF5F7|nr:argininosuccinate lyase [Noviherbaspirillum aerium]